MFEQTLEMYSSVPSIGEVIPSDRDRHFNFPPNTRDQRMTLAIEFRICREAGMGPYWQTMFIVVDQIHGDTIAFNTNYKLPTYETLLQDLSLR